MCLCKVDDPLIKENAFNFPVTFYIYMWSVFSCMERGEKDVLIVNAIKNFIRNACKQWGP